MANPRKKSKRSQVSAELQAEVMKEHLFGSVSVAELSKRYGVPPLQITNWKTQVKPLLSKLDRPAA